MTPAASRPQHGPQDPGQGVIIPVPPSKDSAALPVSQSGSPPPISPAHGAIYTAKALKRDWTRISTPWTPSARLPLNQLKFSRSKLLSPRSGGMLITERAFVRNAMALWEKSLARDSRTNQSNALRLGSRRFAANGRPPVGLRAGLGPPLSNHCRSGVKPFKSEGQVRKGGRHFVRAPNGRSGNRSAGTSTRRAIPSDSTAPALACIAGNASAPGRIAKDGGGLASPARPH